MQPGRQLAWLAQQYGLSAWLIQPGEMAWPQPLATSWPLAGQPAVCGSSASLQLWQENINNGGCGGSYRHLGWRPGYSAGLVWRNGQYDNVAKASYQ